MTDSTATQRLLFPEIFAKPIRMEFDQRQGSSDGGAVRLTAAAYVLMQELRLQAALTDCARAQVWILRERFLKLGARGMVSMRRVVIHLPQSFPFLAAFRQIAMGLGASPG